MLHRVLGTVFGQKDSDFEAYYTSLHRRTRAGLPTVQEASRDYRAIHDRDLHYVA